MQLLRPKLLLRRPNLLRSSKSIGFESFDPTRSSRIVFINPSSLHPLPRDQPHVIILQSLSLIISFHPVPFLLPPNFDLHLYLFLFLLIFSNLDRIGSSRSLGLLVCISGASSPSRFFCVHAFHPHVDSASLVHHSFALSLSLCFFLCHTSTHPATAIEEETKKPMLWLEEWMNHPSIPSSRGRDKRCFTFHGYNIYRRRGYR